MVQCLRSMAQKWLVLSVGRWDNTDVDLAPPTQGRAYEKLVEEEMVAAQARASRKKSTGDAQLINTALKLEHEQ